MNENANSNDNIEKALNDALNKPGTTGPMTDFRSEVQIDSDNLRETLKKQIESKMAGNVKIGKLEEPDALPDPKGRQVKIGESKSVDIIVAGNKEPITLQIWASRKTNDRGQFGAVNYTIAAIPKNSEYGNVGTDTARGYISPNLPAELKLPTLNKTLKISWSKQAEELSWELI